MEMKLDARFMDVKKQHENFVFPEKTESFHTLNIEELEKQFRSTILFLKALPL